MAAAKNPATPVLDQYNELVAREDPSSQQLCGVLKLHLKDVRKVFLLGDQTAVLVHVTAGGTEKWSGIALLADGSASWDGD